MDLNLTNKIIIVTGGARGIGGGIVNVLAREGAIPVIIGRSEEDNLKCIEAVEAAGGRCYHFVAELIRPDECKKAVYSVFNRFGRIDGLVNNAGENDGVGLESGNYESFIASLHKNLVHYYLIAKCSLPALKQSKGAILNITSKVADTGQGNTSAYAAANGGRNALTREWAVELLKYGIRVNAIVVAECWTPLYENWITTLPRPRCQTQRDRSKNTIGKPHDHYRRNSQYGSVFIVGPIKPYYRAIDPCRRRICSFGQSPGKCVTFKSLIIWFVYFVQARQVLIFINFKSL